jgi:hypothetical protein
MVISFECGHRVKILHHWLGQPRDYKSDLDGMFPKFRKLKRFQDKDWRSEAEISSILLRTGAVIRGSFKKFPECGYKSLLRENHDLQTYRI